MRTRVLTELLPGRRQPPTWTTTHTCSGWAGFRHAQTTLIALLAWCAGMPVFGLETPAIPPAPVATPVPQADIRAGLAAHDRALFIKNDWIRDPYIILGPDDFFYLTGTTIATDDQREESDPYNVGLGVRSAVGWQCHVWRSKDLIEWENLGTRFDLTQTAYVEEGRITAQEIRREPLWAPEVHWVGDRWALVHCPAKISSLALTAGAELAGPWTHPMGTALDRKHDPSLFQDTDGTWYMLWGNTQLAPLARDFTRFTAPPVRIDPAGSRPDPRNPGQTISRIGHEGATMGKIGDKYVHFGTAWSTDIGRKGSYNLYYCTADVITGPYGPRKFAGRFLGHGTPFRTRDGKWWCTAFFNANVKPLPREGIAARDLSKTAQTINQRGTTIVPLEVTTRTDGEIYIRAKDPDYATPGPDENQRF